MLELGHCWCLPESLDSIARQFLVVAACVGLCACCAQEMSLQIKTLAAIKKKKMSLSASVTASGVV